MKSNKLSYSAFLKKVKDTLKCYDMLHSGDKVLVAVSGGPDSVCLLRVLTDIRRTLGVELAVANLDHGIRLTGSKEDSIFVKNLAEKLGLPYEHKEIKLAASVSGKRSLEEKARDERYKFLKQSALKHGCNVIATGHTADDQAETVLMRLMIGTSLKGISGIPVTRYEDGLKIIRPLIRSEKREILDHLEREKQEYREDSTNRNENILRNNIRLNILPFLEKYNPKIRRTLVNLCDTVREDIDFIEREKERAAGKYPKNISHPSRVKIRDIILQPKALSKAVFKKMFILAGGDVKKLTYRHWMDVDYFVRSSSKGRSLDLPGNVRIERTNDEIVFSKVKQ